MKKTVKLFLLLGTLFGSPFLLLPLSAEVVLDQVMSAEEQEKTGINQLSRPQKLALETWLNNNFDPKPKEQKNPTSLRLSINIDQGRELRLSDDSVWEVDPRDIPIASIWISPFEVSITPSQDPDYPCLITNKTTNASIRARQKT